MLTRADAWRLTEWECKCGKYRRLAGAAPRFVQDGFMLRSRAGLKLNQTVFRLFHNMLEDESLGGSEVAWRRHLISFR